MSEYIGAIAFGAFMIGFLLGFFLNESTRRCYHYVPDPLVEPKQMREPTELQPPTTITCTVNNKGETL